MKGGRGEGRGTPALPEQPHVRAAAAGVAGVAALGVVDAKGDMIVLMLIEVTEVVGLGDGRLPAAVAGVDGHLVREHPSQAAQRGSVDGGRGARGNVLLLFLIGLLGVGLAQEG